jgi:hypothetical protein
MSRLHYSTETKKVEHKAGPDYGNPHARRIISWPDPFQSSTWATPTDALDPKIHLSYKQVLVDKADHKVMVSDRDTMIAHMMHLRDMPRFSVPMTKEWVIKEFSIAKPNDAGDVGYAAARNHLIIASFSGDTRGYSHDGQTDEYPRLTRFVCPVYRHWRSVHMDGDQPVVRVYIAMPRASTTLDKYLGRMFDKKKLISNDKKKLASIGRRIIDKMYIMEAQVLSFICMAQSKDLAYSHWDLQTTNVLVWDPKSSFYKNNAPDYVKVTVKYRSSTRVMTIPIKARNMPWLWVYDFDLSESDRWAGSYPLTRIPKNPYADANEHIRSYQDVIRFFGDFRAQVVAILNLTVAVAREALDRRMLTEWDLTLLDMTGGFEQAHVLNHIPGRIYDRKDLYALNYTLTTVRFDTIPFFEGAVISDEENSAIQGVSAFTAAQALMRSARASYILQGKLKKSMTADALDTIEIPFLDPEEKTPYSSVTRPVFLYSSGPDDVLFVSPDDRLFKPEDGRSYTRKRPFRVTAKFT